MAAEAESGPCLEVEDTMASVEVEGSSAARVPGELFSWAGMPAFSIAIAFELALFSTGAVAVAGDVDAALAGGVELSDWYPWSRE